MNYLNINSLLIVGSEVYRKYFKNYFNEMIIVSDNIEAYNLYKKKKPAIIFLAYAQNNAIDILKDIRRFDRKTIVVFIVNSIDSKIVRDLLPLQLFSYLQEPFDKGEIKQLLLNIDTELKYLDNNIKRIKNNYSFNLKKRILYNKSKEEVKLTKNEKKFLKIMFDKNESVVPIEEIEYSIWEEDALSINCNGRLKSLLNGLRKKLPKESIINEYGLGYKLNL
jgi:DNA-binding response OmpR family regulator